MVSTSKFKGRNMETGLVLLIPILHLLLLVMCPQGIEGRDFMDRRIRAKTDGDNGHETTHHDHAHHAHPSSHMHHMDHSLMIFFTLKDLKLGKTMAIYFPKRNPSKSPHLLPRVEAELFPFSSKQLHHLLQVFSFSQDSPQAKAMEDTLRQCETEPIKGEIKSCATSLESMLDFARSIFGLDNTFSVVSTTHLTNSSTHFQNYTILEEPKEVLVPKMVACHTMPYPYAVFYCHSQESMNKVYKVSLGGEDGDRVDAVAVCHLDTSQWSPNHASFQVLRIKPGSSPVCHFFPADNLVWVPTSTSV
ncbi:BURP domain protein USPL1 [Pyrus x bretschneideri]|uniref:BURP domain protein USPL1 n=1 Tax=Pyrus x bretschneideri TaxID=225117 RepID=UPI00087092D4|nr:BURP domain protein USPL1 [Pyrus x bretschneideri]